MAEIIIFIFSGVFIGIAAGLFGLGGGLMIVPVVTYCLVYFSNTPFDQAIIIGVSTSLASLQPKPKNNLMKFLSKRKRKQEDED